MNSVATFFSNPTLVVDFQKLCGVQVLSNSSNDSIGNCTSDESSSNYPKKRRHGNNPAKKLKSRQDDPSVINYLITNRFLHALFHAGAFLCNEGFYVIVFPFLLFNIDQCAFRQGCYYWCLVMYIGQAAKDIIKQPRPPSPPVARLESRYDTEYGMPSTHAMMGTAMPFALFYSTYLRYEYPKWLGITIACSWTILVCLSRLYLGMHDLWQVIVGVLMTLPIVITGSLLMNDLDVWILSSPYSPVVILIVSIILVLLYPAPKDRWTSTRGDTTMILSGSVGACIGLWLQCRTLGRLPEEGFQFPRPISIPTLDSIAMAILRWTFVVIIIVPLRAVMKSIIFTILPLILPKSEVEPSKRAAVELPYRFINYGIIGFTVTYISPLLMRYLGIYGDGPYGQIQ
ncbi:Sphingosine-1-phosphate phosphatase 2 [Trichoplax sp. H2]|nr:Sphingosine-1-phosphate phosphatase 2 [Trichoplax sp. H2]|eukprot:RDD37311.1 Sphingosine-1-phosphate phosphatase 2 [Trichoplax sp. H2]